MNLYSAVYTFWRIECKRKKGEMLLLLPYYHWRIFLFPFRLSRCVFLCISQREKKKKPPALPMSFLPAHKNTKKVGCMLRLFFFFIYLFFAQFQGLSVLNMVGCTNLESLLWSRRIHLVHRLIQRVKTIYNYNKCLLDVGYVVCCIME